MIKKYWEMQCEVCGCCEHFVGTRMNAEDVADSNGSIIERGRYFYTEDCYERYKQNVKHGPRGSKE